MTSAEKYVKRKRRRQRSTSSNGTAIFPDGDETDESNTCSFYDICHKLSSSTCSTTSFSNNVESAHDTSPVLPQLIDCSNLTSAEGEFEFDGLSSECLSERHFFSPFDTHSSKKRPLLKNCLSDCENKSIGLLSSGSSEDLLSKKKWREIPPAIDITAPSPTLSCRRGNTFDNDGCQLQPYSITPRTITPLSCGDDAFSPYPTTSKDHPIKNLSSSMTSLTLTPISSGTSSPMTLPSVQCLNQQKHITNVTRRDLNKWNVLPPIKTRAVVIEKSTDYTKKKLIRPEFQNTKRNLRKVSKTSCDIKADDKRNKAKHKNNKMANEFVTRQDKPGKHNCKGVESNSQQEHSSKNILCRPENVVTTDKTKVVLEKITKEPRGRPNRRMSQPCRKDHSDEISIVNPQPPIFPKNSQKRRISHGLQRKRLNARTITTDDANVKCLHENSSSPLQSENMNFPVIKMSADDMESEFFPNTYISS